MTTGLIRMARSLVSVSVSGVSVVSGLFVSILFMVGGGLAVMLGSLIMMFGGRLMVVDHLLFGHCRCLLGKASM